MSDSIIIAEMSKGTIAPVTAELVSAAIALGTSPTVIVPCTDASSADGAGYEGVSGTIAVKGACFENYDASSWAAAIDAAAPSGIIVAAATPQSKDVAARIAARRGLSIVQDVVSIDGMNLTSPIYSVKQCKPLLYPGMQQYLLELMFSLQQHQVQQMFQLLINQEMLLLQSRK